MPKSYQTLSVQTNRPYGSTRSWSHLFKDCLPYLFHDFRNKYVTKISIDNMQYFQNELYKF